MTRVIGYNDPRKLNELSEWDELKKYPHFCISQTLVQGLSREYGRTEFRVLTTIDRLIKKFYREWTDNQENDVKHYLDIRKAIEKIENKKLKKSFMENRMEVYNSVKFLLECDITSEQLNKKNLTKDKEIFIDIYEEIENNPNWKEIKELDSKTMYSFKEAIKEIIIDEIEREINEKNNVAIEDVEFSSLTEESKNKYLDEIIIKLDEKIIILGDERGKRARQLKERLEMYKDMLSNYKQEEIKKVIFHGVHQFTPIMLKLIKYIERNGIEVIFLINYNCEFKRLYSTWDKVYSWTKCDIEKNITKYKYDCLNIAQNYSAIVEGNFKRLIEDNNIIISKFDNYTEMANYISKRYEEAKKSLKGDFTPSKVLGNMSEQFYSVDGSNINDMLKVYFPEQFEQKHFLAYPIGQLILSIYNLWDENKNEIVIKESLIRECIATNIWSIKDESILYTPIEIFELIKVYFSDLEGSNIEEYLNRIDILKDRIEKINKISEQSRKDDYRRLGFYRVGVKEIEFFKKIILEIKNIIEVLMGNGEEVNMITHYKNLLLLISEKINSNKDEDMKAEIKFVKEIEERLNRLDSTSNESIGAIKETLQFYLAQNKTEDTSNWIVRDFNQIDGGVLLADPNAKERNFKERKAIYHFMEVSDINMQGKDKISLSWPLDEEFIGNDMEVLKIINVCKKEYKNYLRYTLFYALFYVGETQIKISYVENKDDNLKEELYYILKLLNLKEEPVATIENINFKEGRKEIKTNEVISIKLLKQLDIINYKFCEERFLYESLIEGEGCYNGDFLINQYLKNFIGISLLKGTKKDLLESIKYVIPYASPALINDIEHASIEKFKYLEKTAPVTEKYKDIIKNFIFAKFTEEDEVESLLKYDKNKFINEVLEYLNGEKYTKTKKMESKCQYCKYRQICVG